MSGAGLPTRGPPTSIPDASTNGEEALLLPPTDSDTTMAYTISIARTRLRPRKISFLVRPGFS